MNIQLCPTIDDAIACSLCVGAVWGHEYSIRFVAEIVPHVKQGDWTLAIAKVDDLIVGCGVLCSPTFDFDVWSLTWMSVAPELQRRGIGGQLLQLLEGHATIDRKNFPSKRVVVQLTTTVPGFYERYGYHRIAKWDKTSLMIKTLMEF